MTWSSPIPSRPDGQHTAPDRGEAAPLETGAVDENVPFSVIRSQLERRAIRRRRLIAAAFVLLALAIVAAAFVRSTDGGGGASVLVPRGEPTMSDPLAYVDGQDADLERAAAFGLSHPLYTKSAGGVVAAARRTAEFRPLIEDAIAGSDLDADIVEAIVFLESGGRPDVIAGDDPARASGLTQILAETATSFLGMRVDLAESRRLTARIRAAVRREDESAAERLREQRRAIDARFDPAQALAGTVRYLTTAQERLGRDDLAVVSYHMGIGNLTSVLRAYAGRDRGLSVPELVDEDGLSWTRIFFDTTPTQRSAAFALLSRLRDDSPTYYWRVLAAKEIMRLYREDPDRLRELEGCTLPRQVRRSCCIRRPRPSAMRVRPTSRRLGRAANCCLCPTSRADTG